MIETRPWVEVGVGSEGYVQALRCAALHHLSDPTAEETKLSGSLLHVAQLVMTSASQLAWPTLSKEYFLAFYVCLEPTWCLRSIVVEFTEACRRTQVI